MHTWEAAFFGPFLGKGWDTFLQAVGSHFFLPGILSWSARVCLSRHCAPCVQQVRAVERTEAKFATWWVDALVVELSDWEEMLAVSQPIYYGAKSVMHHLREPLTHWILQVVLAETLGHGYGCWISSALSHLMCSGSSKCGKFSYHRIENFRIRSKGTGLHFSLSPSIFTKLGGWLLFLFRYKKLLDGSFFKSRFFFFFYGNFK